MVGGSLSLPCYLLFSSLDVLIVFSFLMNRNNDSAADTRFDPLESMEYIAAASHSDRQIAY